MDFFFIILWYSKSKLFAAMKAAVFVMQLTTAKICTGTVHLLLIYNNFTIQNDTLEIEF